jgi:uncharacterized phage protein (TIGR02216 family)
MSFSTSAARLAGLAGVVLGWRPAEFWAATPEELAALIGALTHESSDQPVTSAALQQMQEHFPDG